MMSEIEVSTVTPSVNYPEMEEGILALWRERNVVAAQRERARRPARVRLLRGAAHGQWPPRHPPCPVARVQGHLPPLQDHAGLLLPAPRRLGHARPARGDRGGEAARPQRQGTDRGIRRRGVQPPLPRLRPGIHRRVGAHDRAHGLLGGPGHGLCDLPQRVHRVALVDPQAVLGPATCSTWATRSCPTARAAARR